jgi:hypothetical protein
MPKPVSKPDWTSANPSARTEPSGSKKNSGWLAGEKPPFQFFNWLFFNIDEWIDYFEAVTDGTVSSAAGYDGYVGTIGPGLLPQYATINAAVAALPAGSRILVVDSYAPTATEIVSKNNMEIDYKRGVTVTKAVGATYGLQVQASGVRINNGRFVGYIGGGEAGIRVDAASTFCSIIGSRFINNTLDIDDQNGAANAIATHNEA